MCELENTGRCKFRNYFLLLLFIASFSTGRAAEMREINKIRYKININDENRFIMLLAEAGPIAKEKSGDWVPLKIFEIKDRTTNLYWSFNYLKIEENNSTLSINLISDDGKKERVISIARRETLIEENKRTSPPRAVDMKVNADGSYSIHHWIGNEKKEFLIACGKSRNNFRDKFKIARLVVPKFDWNTFDSLNKWPDS